MWCYWKNSCSCTVFSYFVFISFQAHILQWRIVWIFAQIILIKLVWFYSFENLKQRENNYNKINTRKTKQKKNKAKRTVVPF